MAGRSHAAALKRIVISGDAVKYKLHGESRKDDAHNARDDMQLAFANARHQTSSQLQRNERDPVHKDHYET